MRLLRLNGQNVDIDRQTAIGITLQAYDFKEPGRRKINVSNSFTIPLTANNSKLIGFSNDIQSTSQTIYGSFSCDYWVENEKLIDAASVRIESIDVGSSTDIGRIKLYAVQRDTIWDQMASFSWGDFLLEFSDYLNSELGEYTIGIHPDVPNRFYSGNFGTFIGTQENGSNIHIPMLFSNLAKYEPGGEGTGFLENEDNIYIQHADGPGGHLCAYIITIFKFIEHKYGVSFLTSSTEAEIIWSDQFAPNVYIHLREVGIASGGTNQWAWQFFNQRSNYPPYEDTVQNQDKTLFDLVNSFFQLFNIIIDEETINGVKTFRLHRFDDIETLAPVINFSNNLDLSDIVFKPVIADYKQVNRIKYESVAPGSPETTGAKIINCLNENLDSENDLFSIDSYFPNVITATYGDSIVDLSTEESFASFTFMINAGNVSQLVEVWAGTERSSRQLKLAAIYGVAGEYNFVEDIVRYPKSYDINKWLTVSDIINFKFFAQYYIQELNASFFINKIDSFNPLSTKPTGLELIRISDKVPYPITEFTQQPWVDGVGNYFTDGQGNLFF